MRTRSVMKSAAHLPQSRSKMALALSLVKVLIVVCIARCSVSQSPYTVFERIIGGSLESRIILNYFTGQLYICDPLRENGTTALVKRWHVS